VFFLRLLVCGAGTCDAEVLSFDYAILRTRKEDSCGMDARCDEMYSKFWRVKCFLYPLAPDEREGGGGCSW